MLVKWSPTNSDVFVLDTTSAAVAARLIGLTDLLLEAAIDLQLIK